MIDLIVEYILLVVLVTAPLVFMLKTRLWEDYFLFFLSLSAFAFLDVYGLYALEHSVYLESPDFVNFSRVFIAYLLVIVSFYIMFPIYQALGPSRLALRWSRITPYIGDKRLGTATVCLLWCFCAVIIAYYFISSGTRPLLVDLAEGRLAGVGFNELVARRSVQGFVGFQWFAVAFYKIPTFIVLYTYSLRHFFPSRAYSRLFWLSLGTALILSLTFLAKGIAVFMFVDIAMAATLLQSQIRIRNLLIALVGLAIAFGLYNVFFAAQVPFTSIGIVMWHRIIEAYSMAAGVILSLFPEHLPFFNGVTINNPRGLLPYQNVDLASVVYDYLYGVGHGGATFSAVWEGYANFGYLGLAVFTMLIQFLVFSMHLAFRLASKSAFTFALFVFLSFEVIDIWMNSLFYTILDIPFLFTLIVLLSVRYGLGAVLADGRHRRDISEVNSQVGGDCLE